MRSGKCFWLVESDFPRCTTGSEALPRSGQRRVISMECLRSFLRRHFAGKPVVASQNIGYFLRLPKRVSKQKYNSKHYVMNCLYINGLDSMDWRFLLVVPSPRESAISVFITENRPLPYLGKFFHRLYILPCRYRYTILEYWSSWHWGHIQEKKHHIRQCLGQQTCWLVKKSLKGINSSPNRWREEYSILLDLWRPVKIVNPSNPVRLITGSAWHHASGYSVIRNFLGKCKCIQVL